MHRVLPLVLALLFAGCLDTDASTTDPLETEATLPPLLASDVGYVCPSGDTFERSPGVCMGTVAPLDEGLFEPAVAVHPLDHDIMAIGVNGVRSVDAVDADPAHPGVYVSALDVFVTSDGSASWTRSVLPWTDSPRMLDPLHPASLVYDPSLTFTPDGVLHVVGESTHQFYQAGQTLPFYTRSTDLGATWSEPVFLDDTQTDRPFIADGPDGELVVAWAHGGDKIGWSWSLDGGRSWNARRLIDCGGLSQVVFRGDDALLLCSMDSDEDGSLDSSNLYLLDTEAGRAKVLGHVESMKPYRNRIGVLPDGGVVAIEGNTDETLAYSPDGRNWTTGPSVNDLMTGDAGTGLGGGATWLRWFTTDPWGLVHVLISISDNASCSGGSGGPETVCFTEHLVLQPGPEWTLVRETRLTPDDPTVHRVPATPIEAAIFASVDHFYGIDFWDDLGVLVWSFEGGVDYTLIEPVTPA